MQRVYTTKDILRPEGAPFRSASTLYREIRAGRFPKPVKISPGRVVWDADEVDSWWQRAKAARIAEASE